MTLKDLRTLLTANGVDYFVAKQDGPLAVINLIVDPPADEDESPTDFGFEEINC